MYVVLDVILSVEFILHSLRLCRLVVHAMHVSHSLCRLGRYMYCRVLLCTLFRHVICDMCCVLCCTFVWCCGHWLSVVGSDLCYPQIVA